MLSQQKDGIMAILAAVLHISDIEFATDPKTDGVFVKNDDVLVLGEHSASQSELHQLLIIKICFNLLIIGPIQKYT